MNINVDIMMKYNKVINQFNIFLNQVQTSIANVRKKKQEVISRCWRQIVPPSELKLEPETWMYPARLHIYPE